MTYSRAQHQFVALCATLERHFLEWTMNSRDTVPSLQICVSSLQVCDAWPARNYGEGCGNSCTAASDNPATCELHILGRVGTCLFAQTGARCIARTSGGRLSPVKLLACFGVPVNSYLAAVAAEPSEPLFPSTSMRGDGCSFFFFLSRFNWRPYFLVWAV